MLPWAVNRVRLLIVGRRSLYISRYIDEWGGWVSDIPKPWLGPALSILYFSFFFFFLVCNGSKYAMVAGLDGGLSLTLGFLFLSIAVEKARRSEYTGW